MQMDTTEQDVIAEAALVDRFVGTYRTQLAGLIDALNRARLVDDGRPESRSVRSCVEAVDFVLASHARFAKSLGRLAEAQARRAA